MLTNPAQVRPPAAVAVLLDSRGAVVLNKQGVQNAAEIAPDVAKLAV